MLSSAGGVIALLHEPEPKMQAFAIQRLNGLVDEFWPEIAEAVTKIEALSETTSFSEYKLASLVASKVYYHLGEHCDAVSFALGAGELFNITDRSEYVETILCKCIDQYKEARQAAFDDGSDGDETTATPLIGKHGADLEKIVERMFKRCQDDREYRQVIGLSIDTRRLDVFRQTMVMVSNDEEKAELLEYSFRVALGLVNQRGFRDKILSTIVETQMARKQPDLLAICRCLMFLNDPQLVAQHLVEQLQKGDEDSKLLAFQIGFDLYESATQQFLSRIVHELSALAAQPRRLEPVPEQVDDENAAADADATGAPMAVDGTIDTAKAEVTVDATPARPHATESATKPEKPQTPLQRAAKMLQEILDGSHTLKLHSEFLIRNNKTDRRLLEEFQKCATKAVTSSGCVVANGFLHCGTTTDTFLRDHLEWVKKATNWARFSAIASLGVIHRMHENNASSYLSSMFSNEVDSRKYAFGGSLYAMGLIHANHGAAAIDYLIEKLDAAQANTDCNEDKCGACLGLGLAAMGLARSDIVKRLFDLLVLDDADIGQDAAIAIGLVMVGTGNGEILGQLITHAKETEHEKIRRGIALATALIFYEQVERADTVIEQLKLEQDPTLRSGAMYTVGLAYAGTADSNAMKQLLHVAVSDVSDEVRRVACISIGFLLFKMPDQCPTIMSLLTESYNPHVRYGAAMALGIACAGTGNGEALGLLEPMLADSQHYVRMGVQVASALILIQQNEKTCPKMKAFRAAYLRLAKERVISDQDMAKFGAQLAMGIIDAGGRNCTISMQTSAGHLDMQAIVGMLLFQQFWIWFPLAHMLGLALKPTCLIGLNSDLRMPKIQFRSDAKPSLFAYVPPLEEKKDKPERVDAAVLSTTLAQQRREQRKKDQRSEKGSAAMEVDAEKTSAAGSEKKDSDIEMSVETSKSAASTPMETSKPAETKPAESKPAESKPAESKPAESKPAESKPAESMQVDDETATGSAATTDEKEKKEKKAAEEEPTYSLLDNPCRVMRAQLKFTSINAEETGYRSVKQLKHGGIVMLSRVGHLDKDEQLVEMLGAGGGVKEPPEPEPPEAFRFEEEMLDD